MINLEIGYEFETRDVLVEWNGETADPWVNLTFTDYEAGADPVGSLPLSPSQAMELAAWLLTEAGRAMGLPPEVIRAMRKDLTITQFSQSTGGE